MSEIISRSITVHGESYRVWEKGEGEPLGFFPGLGGLPAWQPLLESLSAQRRVIAPSLPGFPGGGARICAWTHTWIG